MVQWIVAKRIPRKIIKNHPEADEVILQLLYNRGVILKDDSQKKQAEKIKKFLVPDFKKDLHDPFKISGMKKVVSLIRSEVAKTRKPRSVPTDVGTTRSRVGIFGDFDADGICGSALLAETLEKLGLETETYIPMRKEGYGMNKAGIDDLKRLGVGLLFTVDLGITNIGEIEYARKEGMRVVILDHHEPEKELPKANAIIDLKQKKTKYPFKNLSAAGVVFKLVQALHKTYPKKISESYLKWSLDLVGTSTICDVVPLIDENRILAKYGLIVLKKTRRIGILELYKAASIEHEKIDAYTVGFVIGPRINAPGRIGNANLAYALLRTKDPEEGGVIAKKINDINIKRQKILDEAFKVARKKLKKERIRNKKIFVLSDKSFESGIVGLIAGRLKDEFFRPVIAFSRGEEESRGSARSTDEFDIVAALRACGRLLEKAGGHKKAAGATLKNKNFDKMKKKLEDLAEKQLTDEDILPKIKIDMEVVAGDLRLELAKQLISFEPAGMNNPRAKFMLKNIKLASARTVGNDGKHLKMAFKVDHERLFAETENPDEVRAEYVSAIAFNGSHHFEDIKPGDRLNIVFGLEVNRWNGKESIDLKILDLKKSDI